MFKKNSYLLNEAIKFKYNDSLYDKISSIDSDIIH